jgi:hypothetical protein
MQVLASLRHGGLDIRQAEADDVVLGVPVTVGVIAEHPAGSPAAADRVVLLPDEHGRQHVVKYQVARIQVILERPTARIWRDDHPDNGQFFLAELTNLVGAVIDSPVGSVRLPHPCA